MVKEEHIEINIVTFSFQQEPIYYGLEFKYECATLCISSEFCFLQYALKCVVKLISFSLKFHVSLVMRRNYSGN